MEVILFSIVLFILLTITMSFNIDVELKNLLQEEQLMGIFLSIIKNNETIYSKGFGY